MKKYTWDPKTSRYGGTDDLDAEYRHLLLDEKILPLGLTRPKATGAASTDVHSTRFVESTGGVHRLDCNEAGDVISDMFIPLIGQYRKVIDGKIDPAVGDAYAKQGSAYSTETKYQRGAKIGKPLEGE